MQEIAKKTTNSVEYKNQQLYVGVVLQQEYYINISDYVDTRKLKTETKY